MNTMSVESQDVATVYIVDDDPAVRSSLTFMLEKAGLHCVAFETPNDVLLTDVRANPGCWILDLSMPEMNGLDLIKILYDRGCDKPFIVLTGFGTVPAAVDAMRLGAIDFLEKPIEHTKLIECVHEALRRDSESMSSKRDSLAMDQRLRTLTSREREVMELVANGLLSKQIAAQLKISIKTVEVHRSNVTKKLGVQSVAHLVRILLEHAK